VFTTVGSTNTLALSLYTGGYLPIEVAEFHDIPYMVKAFLEEHPEAELTAGQDQQVFVQVAFTAKFYHTCQLWCVLITV
jgi:hypothetical protein